MNLRLRLQRILLALLAATNAVVGVWAGFAPRSFYDDFPGGGRGWVRADGPFNEHLVRDVGTLELALAVVLGVAAWHLGAALVRAASAGALVFALPHLVYHARHLDLYATADQVANVVVLSLAVAGAAAVLALSAPAGRTRAAAS